MQPTPEVIAAKQQWHIFLLLLPFMTGIYLADYRNFTDTRLYFCYFLSWLGLLFLFPEQTRQIGVYMSFLALGFFCQFFNQHDYSTWKALRFKQEINGVFEIKEIETKGELKKCKGVFYFTQDKQKITLPLLCYVRTEEKLQARGYYLLRCLPERIQNESYPGAFDQERFYELQGIGHRAYVAQNQIISIKSTQKHSWSEKLLGFRQQLSTLFKKGMHADAEAVGRALILGERDGIDNRLRTYFMATGSMHILAVSGMHIGLLIVVLLKLLGLLANWISRRQALLLVLLVIWYYAFLTGMSASVLRSVFMYSVLLFSQFSGRQMGNLSGLFFSAFCLLVFDPSYLYDLGFQLSYLAMLGIYLYYDLIKAWCTFRWAWLQSLWTGTALGLAATLTTLPLSLYHFHVYPNYAQIANLLLMSLSSLILIVGMFFPVLQYLPIIDTLSAKLLQFAIELMLWIMRIFSEAPGALAKGIEVPFWWVALFWLLTYFWFYNLFTIRTYWLKSGFLFCLLWMSLQKQMLFYNERVFYLNHEKLILYKCGNRALALGIQPKKKVTFVLEALQIQQNCQLTYQQIKHGTYHFVLPNIQIHIDNQKDFRLRINAKKQSQKIECF
ncbi:MAG: ComEC/Rec2 family competence protein [Sphingomonadales bacterium]